MRQSALLWMGLHEQDPGVLSVVVAEVVDAAQVPKGLVQAYRNGPRKVFELSQEGRALAEALNDRVVDSATGEAGAGAGSEVKGILLVASLTVSASL